MVPQRINSIGAIYDIDQRGFKIGLAKFYYVNGDLRGHLRETAYFKDGTRHGNCFNYDPSGKIIKQTIYQNGNIVYQGPIIGS